ncbi:heme lyase CcmF/NrfE family subunit [Noviherbaspirillum denitrificans]|uniref:C-type cytochrome biogenesis protein CcmF n=1 Tax=Noviherbaspirillum denitrificans TaxID=1968433 RepID=A0A254TA28_9BURK|nr:heme lyase CcmF/NrfE family subunit [Noviherbaspirillum denitrificans]OWW19509.1 c-type cytochrome biogenesis protein CcmF [Noviherbaspirillum denitrificans]
MIPELGNFACMLALAVALVQGILPIAGSFKGNQRWMALARPAAASNFLLITVAFGCLVYAFVTNDFTVTYVASNSNSSLPVYYRVAGAWGGHEGSLLLWLWMLVMWSFAVAVFSRQLPDETVARVLGVMGLVAVGFLAFLLFTSNPFDRLLPGAPDGRDLNPLLQDFGMIIHPPLLYMGYVGFSVAFAFAIAALMGGQLDAAWARWSRPWTSVAWMFLTLGIFMGSFWAYYELGWGGWWFWDPVENASFMPWLVGTALIHSLAVTEKRGSFKNWTVLLAIIAFSLSLLGTFLVRSGVLTSVHAFATDPERGLFILIFLAIVIGGSLLLYAWRAPKVGLGGSFKLISRETALLVNNVLLLVASGTVLLGTLYPLFLDALALGKISVGPPYFESVFVPLMIPVLLLVAVGPFVRWKDASLPELLRRLRWVAAVSVGVAIALALVLAASPMITAGLAFALWIIFASISHIVERVRHAPASMPLSKRLAREPRSYWAMLLAHAGIGVFVIGVTMVKGFDDAKDVNMRVGETATVNGYAFTMKDLAEVKGPNYIAARGTFEVVKDGKLVTMMYPEKRMYLVQKMPMTEAGIDRGFTRDLYVSLGEATQDGAWIVRVQHKPFVGWIWGGCIIMAIGGLLAASDRRYRVAARQKKEAAAMLAAKPV